jgi:hypothetical protein
MQYNLPDRATGDAAAAGGPRHIGRHNGMCGILTSLDPNCARAMHTRTWISACAVRTIRPSVSWDGGLVVNSRKIAVVAVLCAVVTLVACRREEYVPMKLGGATAEQPAR